MKPVNSRIFSLMRKEFIQILRDPRTLSLILVIPIMQLLLMGYAATTDIRNVPMAVWDQDQSSTSRELLDAYRAADYFSIEYYVHSEEELQKLIDYGDARAGLIIPPDYSEQIETGKQSQIALVLDGSDPSTTSTALSAAQLIAQQHSNQIQVTRLDQMGQTSTLEAPIEMRTQVWYNPDLISAYHMVPGVIAQILFSITSVVTATTVVRERERGTIEQLIVTPLRSWELIFGKLVPYIILAFLNTFEVMAIGSLLFGVPVEGNLFLIMALSGLFLIAGLGLGLLISTVANTQQEAMLGVFMTILPSIYLSGFFFPIEAMPLVLQWISYIIPMRYFLVIIRSLLLKGVGAAALYSEIIALTAFAIGIMTLAILRFKKRLD